MTVDFLLLNGLITLAAWSVPMLVAAVLLRKLLPLKHSLPVVAIAMLLISYISSANHPKIRITDQVGARTQSGQHTFQNSAPEAMSYGQREVENRRLYEENMTD